MPKWSYIYILKVSILKYLCILGSPGDRSNDPPHRLVVKLINDLCSFKKAEQKCDN